MKPILALSLSLFAAGIPAQTSRQAEAPTLERLCGKLIRAEYIPAKGEPHTFVYSGHNLPHVTLRLFAANGNGNCCDGLVVVATATTGYWGSFQLKSKRLPGGFYWLEAEPNGRKYRMLIRYTPKKNSDELCSEIYWQVDDKGDFEMGHYITVD